MVSRVIINENIMHTKSYHGYQRVTRGLPERVYTERETYTHTEERERERERDRVKGGGQGLFRGSLVHHSVRLRREVHLHPLLLYHMITWVTYINTHY